MVKMLTVLVSTIPNSHVILLKKCEKLLQMQKLLTFFQQNISIYAIFNDQSFNDTLTNDIVSFEQLSPGHLGLLESYFICKNRLRSKLLGVWHEECFFFFFFFCFCFCFFFFSLFLMSRHNQSEFTIFCFGFVMYILRIPY